MLKNFDKNGVLRAMVIALVLTFGGLAILGWQYRQLESRRLPALEQQISQQQSNLEKSQAQDALASFMDARIAGNSSQAMLYMTEKAVQSEKDGLFKLIPGYQGYRIINGQQNADGSFRFNVEVDTQATGTLVESIVMVKVSGTYYVDSVELAG